MILLGVTASIAAYKAAEVLRRFVKAGREVRVVMTPSATHFVGPLTFQALSGFPVLTDVLDARGEQMAHLDLPEHAKAVVIAPASAECLSQLARGGAADLVTASVLAIPRDKEGRLSIPVYVAPAMHEAMWRHPATQANVKRLQEYGYTLIGPEEGALGRSGDAGLGRMSEPEKIVERVLTPFEKR
jgi:phosphopantothenoylcysteine decarboxylase / phosphopantothenate---cysteine ligase